MVAEMKANLCDLALSSLMFHRLTSYDKALQKFLQSTGGRPNLTLPEHRQSLLQWLNDWGCRIPKEHHQEVLSALHLWYERGGDRLFPESRLLRDLSDGEMTLAATAYGQLRDTPRIGPTTASKVLFALRPGALLPWDQAMRSRFGWDDSPASYLAFLRATRRLAREVGTLCDNIGLELAVLPKELGTASTVPELLNKYLWVTSRDDIPLPPAGTLARWAAWGTPQEG